MGPAVAAKKLGDEAVVAGPEARKVGSTSASLSRTWRITSASRLHSVSTGEPSSCSAARIRAKFFGLGYYSTSALEHHRVYSSSYQKIPSPCNSATDDVPALIQRWCHWDRDP